jgi:A/G-specific adenine glycosylase
MSGTNFANRIPSIYNPDHKDMALSTASRSSFRHALLCWYEANARDLPWRQTDDPYRIWISEVMLQQTRVAVVVDRYSRFLQKFPSVRALARAPESAVLAEWSGLGYYRRARNLRNAAKLITREHSGIFPRSADALLSLPGVGRYTAAAVASIAFDQPIAVVDGNVERVLSRLHGHPLAGEGSWSKAQELLDVSRPGDFNQAMMELGATVCVPVNPGCLECPIRKFCRTRGRGRSRKPNARQQRREISYSLSQRADSVLLVQRDADDRLMPGMWELPQVIQESAKAPLFSLRHSITVTNFRVNVVTSRFRGPGARWVKSSSLNAMPLTGLARKILRRAEII